MKYFFFSLLILSQIVSCTSDNLPPNENVDALYQQFHGKYKIINSISSEPLDVNLDGISSSDLLDEIDVLRSGTVTLPYVLITISQPSSQDPKPGYSFIQWWPEQFIKTGPGKNWDGNEIIAFNPDYLVDYDMKGAFREIVFSKDLKQLTINPDESEEGFLYRRPESVTVQSDGRLKVVNIRRIYTRSGVKEVTITTTYERFTTTT